MNHFDIEEIEKKASMRVAAVLTKQAEKFRCHSSEPADVNHIAVDHNAYPTQTVFADPKLLTDVEDLWGCDASVREALQEAAYCPRVYELMRHIKYGRNVTDSDYTELGKLMFDDADNYLFKNSEG